MRRFFRSRLWRYGAIFLGTLILLTATFTWLAPLYRSVILAPIAYSGFLLLDGLGVPISYTGPVGEPGYCEYLLPTATLQVTFGCTGIFALFILLAAMLAFPAPAGIKARGILFVIPVYYVYSIVRLVIISSVGYQAPGALDLVHSYIMEFVNIAFILGAYILWIRYGETVAGQRKISR